METLQTFELYKVQGLIASPGGLSGFLRFYEDNNDFRSGFQVIISAGSPLPKSLSERVRGKAVFESHFLLRHDRDIDRLIRARSRADRRCGNRGIYRARCIGAGRR